MIRELAQYIDHTNLKAEATKEDIMRLCQEARTYQFASVCVNPVWVSTCHQLLADTEVKVCTVIGFPLGATSTQSKAFEAEQAIRDGATELDMVIQIGALKAGDDLRVLKDIQAVVGAASNTALVKVIIETCLLSEPEIVKACQLSKQAEAHFVKTSTGFSTAGAQSKDIALMRATVGSKLGVKASGGIRDYQTLITMLEAGANRIGTSSGIAIISSAKELAFQKHEQKAERSANTGY